MARLRALLSRVLGTLQRGRSDADLEEELRLHLELAAEDMERRDGSAADAARAARLRAGGLTQALEAVRDQRGLPWLEDFVQDVRYGGRGLLRRPGFTAAASVTLALGIGATTAIFSLVHLLVWRDLPVRAPGELVEFQWQYPRDPPMNRLGVAGYETYRDANRSMREAIAFAPMPLPTSAGGQTLNTEWVTANYFSGLGVRPALGRGLEPQDFAEGAAPVAVISWRLWTQRFDRDPAVFDRELTIGGIAARIVGVARPEFSGLLTGYAGEVWLPLQAHPQWRQAPVMMVGRLNDGVSLEAARSEMQAIDRARLEQLAVKDPQWLSVTLTATSARSGLATPLHQQFGQPLLVVMAFVAILLLLTCANIGSMLLARASARQHETTLRAALGATRSRLARQALTESLLLAVLGSALGVAGAYAATGALVQVVTSGTRLPGPAPNVSVPVDAAVLLFSVSLVVVATVIFGMAPALAAWRTKPATSMRGATSATRPRLGDGLVVMQVAISLVLLSVAGLCAHHLGELRGRELGFDRERVLLAKLDAAPANRSRDELSLLFRGVLNRLESIPGVTAVSLSGTTPLSGGAASRFVTAEGFEEPAASRTRLSMNGVAPGYFATYGTALLEGRDFRFSDEGGPRVAIVNHAAASHYFPQRSAIGRRIWLEGETNAYEIVGVAADAKYSDPRSPAPRTVYVHAFQQNRLPTSFSVRTDGSPTDLAPDVRRVIEEALQGSSVRALEPLSQQVDATIVPERLLATLSAFFGAMGVLLAAIGLYGLLAYAVNRRTSEIGVRVAIGATPRDILRMVLGSAVKLATYGLVIGLPLAVVAMRWTTSVLPNVPHALATPRVLDAVVIVAVALVAAYLPARVALRIDPITALRAD